jgi:hypothetical protein
MARSSSVQQLKINNCRIYLPVGSKCSVSTINLMNSSLSAIPVTSTFRPIKMVRSSRTGFRRNSSALRLTLPSMLISSLTLEKCYGTQEGKTMIRLRSRKSVLELIIGIPKNCNSRQLSYLTNFCSETINRLFIKRIKKHR